MTESEIWAVLLNYTHIKNTIGSLSITAHDLNIISKITIYKNQSI